MTTPCLICDSSAVLTQDASNALIHLAYALNSFMRGALQAQGHDLEINTNSLRDTPLVQLLHRLKARRRQVDTRASPCVTCQPCRRWQVSKPDRLITQS